jgi:hypothetical protein
LGRDGAGIGGASVFAVCTGVATAVVPEEGTILLGDGVGIGGLSVFVSCCTDFASVVAPEEEAILRLAVFVFTILSNRDMYPDGGSSFLDGSEGFAGGTSGIAVALEDAVSDDFDLDFAFCAFFPGSF